MPIYDKPTKVLMLEFVSAEVKEGQTFKKDDAVRWFRANYPKIKATTVRMHVVGMSVNSQSRKHHPRPQNLEFYFRSGITWTTATIGDSSFRYSPEGNLFETKGSVCFFDNEEDLVLTLGLLNSHVVKYLLLIVSPTVDYNEGPLGKIPIVSLIGDDVRRVSRNVRERSRPQL